MFTLLGTVGDTNMPGIVWAIQGSKILLYIYVIQIPSGYLQVTYGTYYLIMKVQSAMKE